MNSLIYKELGVVEEGQSPEPTMPIWVRVEATGICGTDLKAVFKGHRYFVPPTVLGHEFYGQIEKAPEGFKYPKGTWVVVAPYFECGKCPLCKAGKGDLCTSKKYVEAGSFAEYVGIPEGYEEGIFELPKEEDSAQEGPAHDPANYDVYALAEPFACVLNGVKRLETIKGYSNVLVVGGGPMGALFALYYSQIGIDVSVVEPSEERAEKLRSFGIKTIKQEDVQKGEYDNIVLAVNIGGLVKQYLPLVRNGGTLLVFAGLPKGEVLDVDAGILHYGEVSLKGCSGFALEDFKMAFEMIKANPARYRCLITHKFGFKDGQKAFNLLKEGKAFKILLGNNL